MKLQTAPFEQAPIVLADVLLLCPVCNTAGLSRPRQAEIVCQGASCGASFQVLGDRPVLIDFERSVVDRTWVQRSAGGDLGTRLHGWRRRTRDLLFGQDQTAAHAADLLLRELTACAHRPRILVVGGGTIGSGAARLYADPRVDVLAFDVYASPHVQLLADAHQIPFRDGVFDAVWIQAVLEHVLEPATVVAEIHRVLRPGGVVFAGTPFMQPVHEGAYDFTRFTESGHRWLFRQFERIDGGVTGGPATALIWSIRYFFFGVFRSSKAGWLAASSVFWLRFFDKLIARPNASDGACGVWFLGRRSEAAIRPIDAIRAYCGAQR